MLSKNQKRVLRAFERHGIATLEEVRESSPHWNAAIQSLCDRLYLVERLKDGRYALTREGNAAMASLDDVAGVPTFPKEAWEAEARAYRGHDGD